MPVEIKVPTLGESIFEATVGRWLKGEGQPVSAGEPVVELETDKVNTELAAEDSGVLERILRQEGETVRPGDSLAVIGERGASVAERGAESVERQERQTPKAESPTPTEEVRASPLAERLAEDLHVDLTRVPATGPSGRITRQDVQDFAREGGAPAGTTAAPPETYSPQPEPSTPSAQRPTPSTAPLPHQPIVAPPPARPETRQRLSRRRLTIARRLVEAQHTAAMLTTFNEVDMSAVMSLRKRRREQFQERHGVGLGFMSFFTRASVGALRAFPQLNAELQGDELVLKDYYDIGIAIGHQEGLVVPVVRDADRLTFAEIEKTINGFVEKAKAGTLTLQDLRGGTFTITNGGVFGSLLSTPILNPPQVGILGMHKIEDRAVVVNGEVVVRPMMYLALSYDHRIVDGREAVQFLVRIKELLEDPDRLLLEG